MKGFSSKRIAREVDVTETENILIYHASFSPEVSQAGARSEGVNAVLRLKISVSL